ncbi:MAG: M57 family metalloprotease, partial [Fulvivirga sp.]
GFRHTDFFDRSISCGGSTANEGDGGVGANHIPGTPTGASASAKSWMLACTDGGDRPFNNDDRTALNYLY